MDNFPALDFHDFHLKQLPERLAAGNGALAAIAARELGAISFRIKDTDNAYTYKPGADCIQILAGTEGDTVVELEHELWQGLVHDLESAPGLLYAGKIGQGGGDQMQFVRWEPALRAMFHGRPLYDPQAPLRDGHGQLLDPSRSYELEDDPKAQSEFLDTAGYLVIKNVFGAAEVEDFREQADQLRQRACEGDKESWWGKNSSGDTLLCRVINASVSPLFGGLYSDPRIRRIEQMLPNELSAMNPEEKDGVTVIYKNPGMTEGLSDLPWHRDCGLGGHSVMCPKIVCSIYLYDGTEEGGALRFLPGSHKASYGFMEAADANAPRGVRANVCAGDISLHYSDVMHCAPAPTSATGPHRVSVLLNFDRQFEHHDGQRHYNDVLLSNDNGQVDHLEKVIERR